MALSNPVVTEAVQNEPVIGQHFVECCTEDCGKNCQFYCNHCHRELCEQCRNEHQKSPDTKIHEVVPYRQRKRQLPEEKCKVHQNKDIDIMCEDCQVPLCSKCAMQDHRKHALNDLETIYSERFTLCLDEIYKIHQYFLPTSQDIQRDVMKDTKDIKATMDKIRTSIKAEAKILKNLVDTVTSDKIEQINKMEEAYIEKLQSQDATCKDYVSYLEDLVKEFHGYLSSTKLQNNPLIFSLVDRLNIQPIPETTKPVPPVFTAGQYSKEDVTKLLGRVTVPKTKPENREIKSMETASTHLKPTEKMKPEGEKSDVKKTLSLSFFVTKVREYTVLGVPNLTHLSQDKSGRFWGSDYRGTLVQIDFLGNQLHKIQTNGGYGYHTVTQDGDLIYIKGNKKKVINRMTPKNAVTELIKTGYWEPISIHSSHINGDILVGLRKDGEAKVTRYNTKTGKEIQNMQRNIKGQELYSDPHYITENINGDICTSDFKKRAVVVVNKSGQHRFSYTGQGSSFDPWGICTDLLGHILVCTTPVFDFRGTCNGDTVYLLDQDGQFLSRLLTPQQGINNPRGLCVDDENNLHVGHRDTNTVTVYKYIQ